MAKRWIKFYPQIITSPVFASPELLQTWIWCLCMASYKERDVINNRNQVVHLKVGEFYCGLQKSAEVLGTSRNTLKRRLEKLADLGMISVKSGQLGTLIFIEKFADFQGGVDNKRTLNRAINGHEVKHKQEYNYKGTIKELEYIGAYAENFSDGLSEKAKKAMARRE